MDFQAQFRSWLKGNFAHAAALIWLLTASLLSTSCVHINNSVAVRNLSFTPYAETKVGNTRLCQFLVLRCGVVFRTDELRSTGLETNTSNFSLNGRNNGLGTATAVDKRGYFLTAAHCVKMEPVWMVFLNHDELKMSRAQLVWRGDVSKGQPDIAILRVPFALQEVFEYAKEFKKGDSVVGVGLSPEGGHNLVTQCVAGKVLACEDKPTASPPFQILNHDLPLRRGDSGGPIVSTHGQLLGVNVSGQVGVRWGRLSIEPLYWQAHRLSPAWIEHIIDQDAAARSETNRLDVPCEAPRQFDTSAQGKSP